MLFYHGIMAMSFFSFFSGLYFCVMRYIAVRDGTMCNYIEQYIFTSITSLPIPCLAANSRSYLSFLVHKMTRNEYLNNISGMRPVWPNRDGVTFPAPGISCLSSRGDLGDRCLSALHTDRRALPPPAPPRIMSLRYS